MSMGNKQTFDERPAMVEEAMTQRTVAREHPASFVDGASDQTDHRDGFLSEPYSLPALRGMIRSTGRTAVGVGAVPRP
jgi:hypothetical protein